MDNQVNDQALLSYLRGEASPDEIERIREWLSESEENQKLLEYLKLYWDTSHPAIRSHNIDEAYQRLRTELIKTNSDDKVVRLNTRKSWSNFIWLKVAALICVISVFSFWIYDHDYSANRIPEVQRETVVKKNPRGQKLKTFLPDGSKVTLNTLSTLTYEKPFNGAERVVYLEGEAFFEVKENPEQPFKVVTKGVTTTALGTSFNINGKKDNAVEVALVSGLVQVTNDIAESLTLSPGKMATVNNRGDMEIHNFNYTEKVGWLDGVLSFDDSTVPEIVAKLEDWYGIEIIVNRTDIGSINYTANYQNKSLEEVLEGISFVLHFNYEFDHDTVKIEFEENK